MIRNIGIFGVLVLGTGVSAAPAQAAAPCFAGSWTLTALKAVTKEKLPEGGTETTVYKGRPGIKLALSATVAKYTFTGSKKIYFTRTGGVENLKGWTRYSGALAMRAKVVNGRVATFTKGAKGDAAVVGNFIPTSQPDGDPVPLSSGLVDGYYEPVLVKNAAFTCTATGLRLVDKRTYQKTTTVTDLRFTRP